MIRTGLLQGSFFLAALVVTGLLVSTVFSPAAATVAAPTSTTAAYQLGDEIELSPQMSPIDPDRFHPSAAYNDKHGQYLVVWHNAYPSGHDREVVGQRMDAFGNKIGVNFAISTGAHDRVQPAVVYNHTDDKYLVVYMYDVSGDGKKYDIDGVFVSWDGTVGTPFTIQTFTDCSFWQPAVAYNEDLNEYVVVWTVKDQTSQLAIQIGAYELDHNGGIVYGYLLMTSNTPTNPDITFDPVNHRYLVVWNYLLVGVNEVAYDLRDTGFTSLHRGNYFLSATNDGLFPKAAASLGMFYFVTYEYVNSSTDHDIVLVLAGADGQGLAASTLVSGTSNDTGAAIAASKLKSEYMVAFQRADENGAKVLLRPGSSDMPTDLVDICDYLGANCTSPTVIAGGAGYLFVYLVDTPLSTPLTRLHVYARLLSTQFVFMPVISKN